MKPLTPAQRERSLARARGPGLLLAASGLAQVLLAVGSVVVLPGLLLLLGAATGDVSSLLVAIGIIVGAGMIPILVSLVVAAVLGVCGMALRRLSSRGLAWAGVLLAVPLAVLSATVQAMLIFPAGLLSGLFGLVLILLASGRALMALQDPVVHAGFDHGHGA